MTRAAASAQAARRMERKTRRAKEQEAAQSLVLLSTAADIEAITSPIHGTSNVDEERTNPADTDESPIDEEVPAATESPIDEEVPDSGEEHQSSYS